MSVVAMKLSRLTVSSVLLARLVTAPVQANGAEPKLRAKSVLVIQNKTGRVVLGRAASEVRPIASLTKLAAALVVRARGLKLDRGTVITRADHKVAMQGCRTRLELKWTYRNRDLLHAALMSSDNRATSALGRAVGLHATALVQAMNEQARRIGLKKTTFVGPVGIDHRNVSTAWEVSRLVRAASKDTVLRQVMGKKEHRVVPLKGYIKVYYRNTNPLVGEAASVKFVGSKTGYNAAAGYCLAAVARIRGLGEYTFVLLGAKRKVDRVRDLRALIKWLRTGGARRSS